MDEIQTAVRTLRMTLSRVREAHPELPRMDVRVTERDTESTGASGSSSSAARLIITIDADTKEHAEEHGDQLQEQGCSCQSTGETQVTCDCTGV